MKHTMQRIACMTASALMAVVMLAVPISTAVISGHEIVSTQKTPSSEPSDEEPPIRYNEDEKVFILDETGINRHLLSIDHSNENVNENQEKPLKTGLSGHSISPQSNPSNSRDTIIVNLDNADSNAPDTDLETFSADRKLNANLEKKNEEIIDEFERIAAEQKEAEREEQLKKEAARKAALKKEAEAKEAKRQAALKKEAEAKEAKRQAALKKEAERQAALKKEAEAKEAERQAALNNEASRVEASNNADRVADHATNEQPPATEQPTPIVAPTEPAAPPKSNGKFLIKIKYPDKNYVGKPLKVKDRKYLEGLVMGEYGNDYLGAVLVAQCIRDSMVKSGTNSAAVIKRKYGYTARVHSKVTDHVKRAVAFVFDEGGSAVQHPIYYFYASNYVRGRWHETQKFIVQRKAVRFFSTR